MKLRKKIRLILLPVIILASGLVSSVYYAAYKKQIIDSQIAFLDSSMDNLLLKMKYHLSFSRSYLRQQIDSKEAELIINAKERGEELSDTNFTQFLNRFLDQESKKIVNEFIVFDDNSHSIVHINSEDPFAEPIIKKQTQTIIDNINDLDTANKISQFYYFIELGTDKKLLTLYVIEAFSPYHLISKSSYDKQDNIYLVQAKLNINSIKHEIQALLDKYDGYLQVDLYAKNIISASFSLTSTKFHAAQKNTYQGKLESELFEIKFTLDKSYFDKSLNNLLSRLTLLACLLISFTYFILSRIINQQIINPITSLSTNIKNADASSTIVIKHLKSNDEVAELNESYITLINKIHQLVNNDPLTGLANRSSFNNQLSLLENSPPKDEKYIALFYIDLDNFKYVNDTFGHNAGDQLLIVFSQRLKQILRADDRFSGDHIINSVARLGGDEFVVLINGLPSLEVIKSIGQRICDLFQNGFMIEKIKFDVHASIGIAYSNKGVSDGEKLLNQADAAMYEAKRDGKNTFRLFSSEFEHKLLKEKLIENELNLARDQNTLFLLFMPAYHTSTLELLGYEVLLRCPALTAQGIGPDQFIPIAEKTALIQRIDLWVVENALLKLRAMIIKADFKGFFSINISSKSLRNDDFYYYFKALLDKYHVNVKQIEIEITETCLMPDDYKAIANLTKLKSLGIRIALDDFGTGFTSFGQLDTYPLDTLKIDRSFVKNLPLTAIGKKPTLDIIYELAKVYQLEVIVEGIETKDDFEHVKNIGCEIVQGFYFSTPRIWKEVLHGDCDLVENKI